MIDRKKLGVAVGAALLMGSVVCANAYEAGKVENPGTITGEVSFSGTAPAPEELKVTKDQNVCGKTPKYDQSLVVSDGKLVNAVVSITDIKKGKPLAVDKVVLDQHGCQYHPHVIALEAGTPVEILNPDKILHNVHTYSEKNPPLNKAMPKFKKEATVKFDKPEAVEVKCDVHGWMHGWLFVTDNPYYSVTDKTGKFTLTDVPPGSYTLEVWHEKLGKETKQVTVEPNGEVKVDFTMASK